LIAFSGISKQYGRQVLFVDASFQLNPGEKVGLVGPNGSGKTTLFRMIVGDETADEGDVSVPRKLTIGYFRQDVEEMGGRSAIEEAIAGSGRVGDLHHELESLQHAMADPARAGEMDRILARFGEVQEEYEHLGGYALESQARELGITIPLFGGDGWEAPELIQGPGAAEALKGCFFSTHFSPDQDSPKAKAFVASYEKKYGARPDAMGALGYDSVLALVDAIKRAGSTEGPKIRDALATTTEPCGN
jgi:hypothetical protein